MRIYLDVCCLCRPFDDQGQDRIRLETEAIFTILKHCQSGEWIEALTDALGPLGMVKFLQQLGGGSGDYTKERKELLAGITMDDFKRWCEEKDKEG